MDLMMPDMDGYETAAKIKFEFEHPINKTPILALTGSSSNASNKKIKESGINDFAAKPFLIEELHSKISSLIFENDTVDKNDNEDSQFVNLQYLKDTADGNNNLISEIINIFLNQTPEFLIKLDQASGSQNWNEVKTIAHKMKPTVSYVGISALTDTIKKIEDYSEQKVNLKEIPSLINNLKNICETAFIELRKELKNF